MINTIYRDLLTQIQTIMSIATRYNIIKIVAIYVILIFQFWRIFMFFIAHSLVKNIFFQVIKTLASYVFHSLINYI